MFDTHVNLHGEAYANDLDEVLGRARSAGITRFLAICDRMDNFPDVLAIAEANKDIWCSVGVHPHHAKDYKELNPQDLISASEHPKVVAIGETGLDFHYNYSDQPSQVASLKRHIDVSRITGLPLILHSRDADQLMGDILEEEMQKGAFKPLLHCYTGGIELAQRALKLGAFFSVSGILSFKNARNVHEVIAQIPLERIILETDCPYLAPVPHRGRRNEPAYLDEICTAYAALMGLNKEDVARQTTANSVNFFHKVA